MSARPCSPKVVCSFLVPARKSNSDPALVRASGMMDELAVRNMKRRQIWDHRSWQAEKSECLEDVDNRKSCHLQAWIEKEKLMKQVMDRGTSDGHCRELMERAMKDGRHRLCCLAGDPAQPQWDKTPIPHKSCVWEQRQSSPCGLRQTHPAAQSNSQLCFSFLAIIMKSDSSSHSVAQQVFCWASWGGDISD